MSYKVKSTDGRQLMFVAGTPSTASVAIGQYAGSSTVGNSIVLNASGATLTPATTGLFINPIRTGVSAASPLLMYNSTTYEVNVGTTHITIPGTMTANIVAANTLTSSGNITVGNIFTGMCNASSFNTEGTITGTTASIVGNIIAGNISTNLISTSNVIIRTAAPTIRLQDTNSNVSFIHCENNSLYFMRGATDATTWTAVNGQWPMTLNLTNNDCLVGGNISAIQNVTAYASDIRLKKNIATLENALECVKKLRGVSFDWREDTPQPMQGSDVGLIAQDVASVLPRAVGLAPFDVDPLTGGSKSGEMYLTVDCLGNKMIALLVEAIKELAAEVEALKQ